MNKVECKKYIRRAYQQLIAHNKSMTPENIEIELKNVLNEESKIYIAYSKLAMHNLNRSATEITAKQLTKQIDVIKKLYSPMDVISKSKIL